MYIYFKFASSQHKHGKKFDRFSSSIVVLALIALSTIAISTPQPANAETLNSWRPTTAYPINVVRESCAISGEYIYCVGGEGTTTVYYAPISSSGVGEWIPTTSYQSNIDPESCAISGGYIYCVGGYNSFGSGSGSGYTAAVFYAQISSSGVGKWLYTTDYPTRPISISHTFCAISGGYIYCVGDSDRNSYYAQISSSGVGEWVSTTAYPIHIVDESCAISGGYIYCVGGQVTSAVYYAPISSSGVGKWIPTTAYPTNIVFESCAISGGYIYCVGGENDSGNTRMVYYAAINVTIETITQTTTLTITTTTTTISMKTSTLPVTTTTTTTVMSTTTATTTAVSTATTSVTSTVTQPALTLTLKETVGLPVEVTYGAVGIALVAIVAAAVMMTRKRA